MILPYKERIGEIFVLSKLPIVAFMPLIINYGTKVMPPLLFAGSSTLAAAIPLFFYLLFTKQLKRLADRKSWPSLLGVTLFIAIIPAAIIFLGTSKTSSINTAILLQAELIFTFIICGIFLKEKITALRAVGAFVLLLGTTTILVAQGAPSGTTGDLLIILGTAFYPVGNYFWKRSLELTTPLIIIFVRSFIGGVVLTSASLWFEQHKIPAAASIQTNFPLILANGIGIYLISKILWAEGLKRIDITKAVSLGIAAPAMSVILAALILKETPTLFQIFGLSVTLLGIFIITRKQTLIPIEHSS